MASIPVFDALNRFLHPKPLKPPLSPGERLFLERFEQLVERHQAEPEFTTTSAAASLGMSRMHLNRKLRVLTGQSTHDFILRKRLEEARALLSQPLPIASVAESVGFKSSSHFAKAFRLKLGTTPSDFRAKESLARQPTGKNRSQ
jgi:AraC-like DNA-binding protein